MNFQVTQKQIDDGKTDCRCCPIALAISQEFPNCSVLVGQNKINILALGTNLLTLDTPPICTAFIKAFDAKPRLECKPFTFDLPITPEQQSKLTLCIK